MGDETPQPPVVIVVPENTVKAKLKLYMPWILAVLGFAQLMGWIPEQAANAIRTALPILVANSEPEKSSETEPEAMIAAAPMPAAPSASGDWEPMPSTATRTVEPTFTPVGAMTPEQEQRWIDLIQKIIDALPPPPKPKPIPPEPTPAPPPPEPTPDPTPIDPAPQPTPVPVPPKPTPAPGLLKILVVDELGKPITKPTVEAGTLFRVSATGASGDIAWQVSKLGPARLSVSTDGTEYVGCLADGQWIDFALTDFGSRKQASIRITCNQGPQPPPGPTPPKPMPPGPTPEPVDPVDPPETGSVSLAVVYDTKAITPETAIVLNATNVWNEFTAAGSEWLFYDCDTTEPLGVKAVSHAGETSIPALVIYRKDTRKMLAAVPLPKTVAALRKTVATYTGGE